MCTCISLRAHTHTSGGCAYSCAFAGSNVRRNPPPDPPRYSSHAVVRAQLDLLIAMSHGQKGGHSQTVLWTKGPRCLVLWTAWPGLAWPGHENTDYDSCLQGNGSDINLYVLQLPGESTSICLSVRPPFCLSPVSHLLQHRDLKAFCASLDNFLSQSSSFFKTNSF